MIRRRTVIGLMSGTSLDGADAALVDFWEADGHLGHRLRAFATLPMPASLRSAIEAAMEPGPVDRIADLSMRVGEFLAQAATAVMQQAGIEPAQVDLVGSHGQTLWHLPGRASLQIGEPAVIAERTGITTIADFRPADIAAGGQGAPLVPYADRELYALPGRAAVLLNLGGIANLTWLDGRVPGGDPSPTLAFDTGPGNMVIDAVCRALFDQPFDRSGRIAAKGSAHAGLLAGLLEHPFFRSQPPRSTGREEFGSAYVDRLLAWGSELGLTPADLLATATVLTARTVAHAIATFLPDRPDVLRVSGGGAHNDYLLEQLSQGLPGVEIDVLPDADAKEAVAFALFAYRAAFGQINHVPEATGAGRPLVLGKIVPGRNFGRVFLAPPAGSATTHTGSPLPTTEATHPETEHLDVLSARDLATLMAEEEFEVARAISDQVPAIAEGIEIIADRLSRGGRLFYVGAGTSGRLGVLDAAECPPTFSTPPDQVQALIAGGPPALVAAIEGAEDDAEAGRRQLASRKLARQDVVVGLSASGTAPFVAGALALAQESGCATLMVTCNDRLAGHLADLVIALSVGPEVLSGSTRLKAGTATKIVLNALSTGAMVKLGKVYGNLMVDVHVSNRKLRQRAERILACVAGVSADDAGPLLEAAGGSVKVAIVMRRLGLNADQARLRLDRAQGHLRAVLEETSGPGGFPRVTARAPRSFP